jgi:hypothetical protein
VEVVVAEGVNIRRFTWVNPAGQPVATSGGMTADEVKLNLGQKVSRPDLAPIAARAPVEFISPTSSSENLRLAVPAAANPYATPTGPKHDHMMIRKTLTRSGGEVAKQLLGILKAPPATLAKESVDNMKNSLTREHAMLALLDKHNKLQEMVYSRIIGRQEA